MAFFDRTQRISEKPNNLIELFAMTTFAHVCGVPTQPTMATW